MSKVSEFLKPFDLRYDDLSSQERETLTGWITALETTEKKAQDIKGYVRSLMEGLNNELAQINETPKEWLDVVSLFVPFYGIVRKWYQDQRRLHIEARLQNLMLIYAFLSGPDRAKKALEEAVSNLKKQSKA